LLEKNDIKQLILNLARNGLEAMDPARYLTVKTFIDKEDVVMAVCDQGKGIPPEHLDKMGIPLGTTFLVTFNVPEKDKILQGALNCVWL